MDGHETNCAFSKDEHTSVPYTLTTTRDVRDYFIPLCIYGPRQIRFSLFARLTELLPTRYSKKKTHKTVRLYRKYSFTVKFLKIFISIKIRYLIIRDGHR